MGEQGLAERLAAETARNLTILEGLGERILGRIQDDAAIAKRGTKLGGLPRDVMRMYREYRTGLRELRMEALLRQKLKLLDADDMPMTEEEYQEAIAEMRAEGLLKADRDELERELAVRPQVRLPPASAMVLDVVALDAASEERQAPQPRSSEPRPAPSPLEDLEEGTPEDEEPSPAPRSGETPSAGADPDPDDPDEEGGWV